jgi:hypothetical protein
MPEIEPMSARFALDLAALEPKSRGTNVFVTGPLSLAFSAALSLAFIGGGTIEGRKFFSTAGGVTLASLSGGASASRRGGAGAAGPACVSTGLSDIGGDESLDFRWSVCRGANGAGWAADSVTSV